MPYGILIIFGLLNLNTIVFSLGSIFGLILLILSRTKYNKNWFYLVSMILLYACMLITFVYQIKEFGISDSGILTAIPFIILSIIGGIEVYTGKKTDTSEIS